MGKSRIASAIRQQHAVSVVSTDTLGAVLEEMLSPEVVPDLFVFGRFHEMPMTEQVAFIMNDPAALMAYVRQESHVVWKAVEAFLRREYEEGRDILIEGVAVLPELIHQLEDLPHRVVFLGNQGAHHHEHIKQSAQVHAHDWMRDASDHYIAAFALFVTRMSAYIEQEAKTYGFTYIELDNTRFGDVPDAVMTLLGLNAR